METCFGEMTFDEMKFDDMRCDEIDVKTFDEKGRGLYQQIQMAVPGEKVQETGLDETIQDAHGAKIQEMVLDEKTRKTHLDETPEMEEMGVGGEALTGEMVFVEE